MNLIKIAAITIIWSVLISGCVSTEKYEASRNNAYSLQSEKAQLEERLFETERKLDLEKAARESIEADAEKLEREKAELIRQNKGMLFTNKSQNETISEIMAEKLNAIKEKDVIIGELREEKLNAIKEKDIIIGELQNEKNMAIKEKEKAISELTQTYDSLVSELNDEIKKGEIEVVQLKDKLTLSLVDKILFDSGKTDIKKNGKSVLDRVADIVKDIDDKQIRIEGHTDNIKIGPVLAAKFATNWELSTARSTMVVKYLQGRGVDPSFLSAAGYSEYRPVDSNETEEGRAKNRRIEIVLIPVDKIPAAPDNL
jgi:chemotaxis protein MotB